MKFQEYWNKAHCRYIVEDEYSKWLDKYLNIISQSKTSILDLGCGVGTDSIYLTKKGFNVIACDFSETALKKLNKDCNSVKTILFDITQKLPFKDCSFDIIISDLSLHYFDEQTTKNILKEIKRVLTNNGILICRVNSTQDINHGAGQGEKIEDNYYFVDGYNKRFFDKEQIFKYFSIIGDVSAKESEILRKAKRKIVWEIIVKNNFIRK